MLSRIKKRVGTPGMVIAVIALVLAMIGGAYAASGALTKKQKKEVEKIAKKFAGKPGAAGPTGPQGPAGANGKDGTNGTNGSNGKDGESVTIAAASGCPNGGAKFSNASGTKEACNGAPGQPGEPGQAAGFNYFFNTSTAATDPSSGHLALNNAAPNQATTLSISDTDGEGTGLASVLKSWITSTGASGTLLIREAEEPSTFAQYTITANKDEGTFRNISLVSVDGNGTFANQDEVTIAYWGSSSEVLPEGATEYGTWSFGEVRGVQSFEDKNGNTVTVGTPEVSIPISFPIEYPPAKILENIHVFSEESSVFHEHCQGPFFEPQVLTPETLCVFDGSLAHATFGGVFNVTGGSQGEADSTGANLLFHIEAGGALAVGFGWWAVRN